MYPNLEAELARRNIRRADIAAKTKRHPNTVYRVLSGRQEILLTYALEIRDAIDPNLPVEWLFTRHERGDIA